MQPFGDHADAHGTVHGGEVSLTSHVMRVFFCWCIFAKKIYFPAGQAEAADIRELAVQKRRELGEGHMAVLGQANAAAHQVDWKKARSQ